MDTPKYEILSDGHIRALRHVNPGVDVGDIGGMVGGYRNLAHDGECWIGPNAGVLERAVVQNDAQVFGHATVTGNARVRADARVGEHVVLDDHVIVEGRAVVIGDVSASGWSQITGDAKVSGLTNIGDRVIIDGNAEVSGWNYFRGDVRIGSTAFVHNLGDVSCDAAIYQSDHAMQNAVPDLVMVRLRGGTEWVYGDMFEGTLDDLVKEIPDGCERYYGPLLKFIEQARERVASW